MFVIVAQIDGYCTEIRSRNNCTHCLLCRRRRVLQMPSMPTFCLVSPVCNWNSCFSILGRRFFTCTKWHKFAEEEIRSYLTLLTSCLKRIYFLFAVGSPIDVQNHVEALLKIVALQNVCFVNWINAAISKSTRRYICFVCIRLLNDRKKNLSNFFESRNLAFPQIKPYHRFTSITRLS